MIISKAERRKLIIQFLKFMVGGGIWFWSGYFIFAGLYSGAGWDWLPAKIVADGVGFSLNFLVQRYWAFNDPRLKDMAIRVTWRYVLITSLNFLIDYLIVWGLKTLGISPYIGMFVAAGFFTAWNWFWYKFWVFNTGDKI